MISVIVPAYHEEEVLEETLKQIARLKNKKEIIVSYYGKKTKEIAEKYADKLIKENGMNAANARNMGAEVADGDILAFIDADNRPFPNWLDRIEKNLKNAVACGGPVVPYDGNKVENAVVWLSTDIIPRIFEKVNFFMFNGGNCAYKRDVFFEVGMFREDLHMLEDNELSNRVKKAGKVIHDPRMKVWTTVRRFRKKGLVRTTLSLWGAYVDVYLLKKSSKKYEKITGG